MFSNLKGLPNPWIQDWVDLKVQLDIEIDTYRYLIFFSVLFLGKKKSIIICSYASILFRQMFFLGVLFTLVESVPGHFRLLCGSSQMPHPQKANEFVVTKPVINRLLVDLGEELNLVDQTMHDSWLWRWWSYVMKRCIVMKLGEALDPGANRRRRQPIHLPQWQCRRQGFSDQGHKVVIRNLTNSLPISSCNILVNIWTAQGGGGSFQP